MSNGATLFEVIYTDTEERVPVLIGIGDTVRASDWADAEYPYPPKPVLKGLEPVEADFEIEEYRTAKRMVDMVREDRAGLYACYLGAKRAQLRGTELGWVEWLELVTIPGDEAPAAEATEPGESNGSSSAS